MKGGENMVCFTCKKRTDCEMYKVLDIECEKVNERIFDYPIDYDKWRDTNVYLDIECPHFEREE